MPVVSARQQAELGKTRGSSQAVHSIRRAFQMHQGASEGDALRRLMRRVPSTSTWVHLGPPRRADSPLISHNVEVQPSWDVLWFVKSMRRKQKQTRQRSDEDWNLGWMKVQNDEESSSGQEKPWGGGRKGSHQRDLSTVEICWGLKLHFLKVPFIFHGMLYSPRKILFWISCSSGGFQQPALSFWHYCCLCFTILQRGKQQLWHSCLIYRRCNANKWKCANVSTFSTAHSCNHSSGNPLDNLKPESFCAFLINEI